MNAQEILQAERNAIFRKWKPTGKYIELHGGVFYIIAQAWGTGNVYGVASDNMTCTLPTNWRDRAVSY